MDKSFNEKIIAEIKKDCIIKEILFAGKELRSEGVKSLADALKINTTLLSLDLSKIFQKNIGCNDIGPTGAEYIGMLLQKNYTLKSINLSI